MKQIIFTTIIFLVFTFSSFAQSEKALCPIIEVVGGGVVQTGEQMVFSVKIGDEAKNISLEYEWTISAGTIAGGKGTNSIVVDTTGLSGQNIEAKVTIKGLTENCANIVFEIGSVMSVLIGDPLDNFGKAANNEVKVRIDALFTALGNYPNSRGQLIIHGTDKEITISGFYPGYDGLYEYNLSLEDQ